ncbi:hypothetical protein [Streptosporangium sp. NPDC023615]|uniref:hypothetical protein n=1 Tax=Streptosporangium sp. NPDC023615 TaxID=3154794 RepID=UPI003420667C
MNEITTTATTPSTLIDLLAAPFIAGVARTGMHATPRDSAARAHAQGVEVSMALCGIRVTIPTVVFDAYDRNTPPRAWNGPMRVCPYCAWYVATDTGPDAIARELDALTPTGTLARLLPDPLIARRTCETIITAAQQPGAGGLDDGVVELLAHLSAHAPVLARPWECDDVQCDDSCECLHMAVCPACSLQYESGEQAGYYRPECTITAPCQVLAALAAHLSPPASNPPVDQIHDESQAERAATSGQVR